MKSIPECTTLMGKIKNTPSQANPPRGFWLLLDRPSLTEPLTSS